MHPETVPETNDFGTGDTARAGDTLGYARVSTNDQNLEGQRVRLIEAGAIRVFVDVVSGKRFERPGLTGSSTMPGPEIGSASPGSTDWGGHCESCSKPLTPSRPEASTW